MNSVGTDKYIALGLDDRTVVAPQLRDHATACLFEAHYGVPEPNRLCTEALENHLVQKHLELAAVHRELGYRIARDQAARLVPDGLAELIEVVVQ